MNGCGHTLKLVLLLAILGLAQPGTAPVAAAATADPAAAEAPASADEPAAVDPETAGGEAAAAEPDVPEDADAGGPGDVFVPTEEISEDYAVSFPVDI